MSWRWNYGKKEESAHALKNTNQFTKALLSSRNKPEFCDIKIKTNDGEIAASKFILTIRSEYFRLMFSNNFVESSSGTVKLPYSKFVVDKVIIYLYTGEMVFRDPKLRVLLNVLDLLRMMNLSEEFKQLERYTSDLIFRGKLPLSDCLKNLDKSAKMRMEKVGENLMKHLRNSMDELCKMEDVGVLSEAMIFKLLQEEEDDGDETSDEEYTEEGLKERQEERAEERKAKTLFRFQIFA